MFSNTKRGDINTFVLAVSLYVAEKPKTSTKDHESPLPIMPFGIVAYGFVVFTFDISLVRCAHSFDIDVNTRR